MFLPFNGLTNSQMAIGSVHLALSQWKLETISFAVHKQGGGDGGFHIWLRSTNSMNEKIRPHYLDSCGEKPWNYGLQKK